MKKEEEKIVVDQPIGEVTSVESSKPAVIEAERNYEQLYANEKKKNKVLLIGVGIFFVLFVITIFLGLSSAYRNDDDARMMRPQGMRGYNNRQIQPSYDYR
jgi:hypothetical protein